MQRIEKGQTIISIERKVKIMHFRLHLNGQKNCGHVKDAPAFSYP